MRGFVIVVFLIVDIEGMEVIKVVSKYGFGVIL